MVTKERLAPELEIEGALDEASAAEPGRTSFVAALGYRDFRLFWTGLVVSNVGTWMQIFGLGWLVVQLAVKDGVPQLAPLYLGLVGLARAIPGLTFGLVAGVVADRTDRRRLLMVTQSGAGITAAILAVLTITERINIVEVLLLVALNSIVFSFDAPTRQAMVSRLVTDRELMSAIGLNSAAFNGATLVGPLVGGLLIVPIGVGGLMLINALSYLVIVGALVLMTPQPVVEMRQRRSMIDSIKEGVGFVRRDPVLRWVVVLAVATAGLTRPYIQLMPAEAQFLGVGAQELSWLLAASGAGALGGALATASLGGAQRRGLLLVSAAFTHGLLLLLFAFQRSLLGAMVFIAGTSFAVMLFLGMANTLMQTRSPDHLRGRVMSVHTMVFMGFMPLGQLVLGALGTVVGINNAFLVGGTAVALVATYAVLRAPALRMPMATPAGPRAVARSG
ncbi:MAG: MFS transporter [Chloroflexi bacterium]|nr:MAG: MFS transporter [Chloroflexota bacterium]